MTIIMETKEASSYTIDQILHTLDTNVEHGLTSVEVDRRRQLHDGFNEMNIKEDEPLWKKYIQQVRNYSYLDSYSFCN